MTRGEFEIRIEPICAASLRRNSSFPHDCFVDRKHPEPRDLRRSSEKIERPIERVSGYPDGHPDISQAQLWDSLRAKHKALVEGGYAAEIVTQFGFDSEAVLHWLERLRHEANIHVKVRIGLPGPASVKTLLRFATRCGVGASARVMLKYGVSITKLLNTAGPDSTSIKTASPQRGGRRTSRLAYRVSTATAFSFASKYVTWLQCIPLLLPRFDHGGKL